MGSFNISILNCNSDRDCDSILGNKITKNRNVATSISDHLTQYIIPNEESLKKIQT